MRSGYVFSKNMSIFLKDVCVLEERTCTPEEWALLSEEQLCSLPTVTVKQNHYYRTHNGSSRMCTSNHDEHKTNQLSFA